MLTLLFYVGLFLLGYAVCSLVEKYYDRRKNETTVTEVDLTQHTIPWIAYRHDDSVTPSTMRLTLPYDSYPNFDPHRVKLFGTPIVLDMHLAEQTIRQTVFITDVEEDKEAGMWILYIADAYAYVAQC